MGDEIVVDNPTTVAGQTTPVQPAQTDPPAAPAAPVTEPPAATPPAVDPGTTEPQAQPAQKFNSLKEWLDARQQQPVQPTQPASTEPGKEPGAQAVPAGPTPAEPLTAATPPAQPVTPTPAPSVLPEKFRDKSPEEIARSYTELERWNHQLAQRHGLPPGLDNQRGILQQFTQLQQELAQLKSQPAAQVTSQTQQTAQGAQPAATAAPENALTPEQFQEMLYNEPEKAMSLLFAKAEEAADKKIAAYKAEQQQQVQEYQSKVENFSNQLMSTSARYPDLKDHIPAIERFIQENPYLESAPNAVELAYKAVKADQLMQNPPRPSLTPEQLLQDDNFLQQAAQNEAIRTAVLRGHAEAIRSKQPPPVISSQPGLSPAAAKEEIKSTKDAAKASLGLFNRVLGRVNQ